MSLLVHSPFTMRPFQYSWIPLVTLLCFSSSFLTVLIFQNFSDRRCQTDSLAQHLLPDFNNQRSVAEVGESVASWGPEEAALMTDDQFGEEFDLEVWLQVQRQRVDFFKRRCRQIPPLRVHKDRIYLREQMFVFEKFGVSYCHMPKTSSTTVVNHFKQIYEGYGDIEELENDKGMFMAFKYCEDNFGVEGEIATREAFGRTQTFILVRHPFVRFVSSYRMRYHYLVDPINARFGTMFDRLKEPPFRMFVDFYLENLEQFELVYDRDKHFRTQSSQCDVCRLGVDWIAHTETFETDMMGLRQRLGIPFEHLELKKHVRRGNSTTDLTVEWFRQLTKDQIRQLHEIYWVDFHLYGYDDVDDYIRLGLDE